jgi:hypothetical protein
MGQLGAEGKRAIHWGARCQRFRCEHGLHGIDAIQPDLVRSDDLGLGHLDALLGYAWLEQERPGVGDLWGSVGNRH